MSDDKWRMVYFQNLYNTMCILHAACNEQVLDEALQHDS